MRRKRLQNKMVYLTLGTLLLGSGMDLCWSGGVLSRSQSPEKEVQATSTDDSTVQGRSDLSWVFKAKQAFWSKILDISSKSEVPGTQRPENVEVKMVPFSSVDPGNIDLPNIFTPSEVPAREASTKKRIGFKGLRWLGGTFLSVSSGNEEGPIPNDHSIIQDLIFTPTIERLFPRPIVPQALKEKGPSINEADVFAAVAPASSMAGYLQKKDPVEAQSLQERLKLNGDPADIYEMDLRGLERYEPKPGKSRLGARVNMQYHPETKSFETVSIDYKGEEFTPNLSNPDWIKAKKVAACGLATHSTLIKHLGNAHMLISGQFTGAILKNFNKDHPLRQVLERHGTGAISVNNYSIPNLISGDKAAVPGFSNFNAKEVQRALREHAENFDITSMDVVRDGIKRGVLASDGKSLAKDSQGQEINHPYMEMALKFWNLSQDYLHEVLDYVYENDEAVAADPSVQQFYQDLNSYFRNGINHYTGGKISKKTLADLLSIYIHTVSFVHENVGNITKNYNALPQYFPSQVNENGCNPSVNVAFRYLLTNALTDRENMLREDESGKAAIAKLTDDVSDIVTSDPKLKKIMRDWREKLLSYNDELIQKGLEPFVINPTRCQDAVNQ